MDGCRGSNVNKLRACILILLTVVGCSPPPASPSATASRLLQLIQADFEGAKHAYADIPESQRDAVRRELALLLAADERELAGGLWAASVKIVRIPFTDADYRAAFETGTAGSREGMLVDARRQITDWNYYIKEVQENDALEQNTVGLVLQYVPTTVVATWSPEQKRDLFPFVEKLLRSDKSLLRARGLLAATVVYTLTPDEAKELKPKAPADQIDWLLERLPDLTRRVPQPRDPRDKLDGIPPVPLY